MTERTAKTLNDTADQAIPMASRKASSFSAYCRICAADQLLDAAAIESTHRSAEGVVGYVRCPGGHLVIHRFAEAYLKPAPPQSVIDLRAQVAGQEVNPAMPAAGSF